MKVGIACCGAGHLTRGMETWAKEIAYGLNSMAGIDVTLFKGGGIPESSFEKVVPCLNRSSFLLTRKHTSCGYYIEQLTFVSRLFREIREERYDILHLMDPQVALWMLRAKRRGLIRPELVFNYMMGGKDFSAQFDTVEVPVTFQKEIAQSSGIDTSHWYVIPPAVDTENFRPRDDRRAVRERLKIPEDAFVVLSVGALENHQKRMKWTVREMASARRNAQRKLFFLAVGSFSGVETHELTEYCRKELSDDWKAMVNVPHSLMPDIYAAADVFCLASLYESFGIVYIEAMASGIPVLACNHPIQKWIVGDAGECIDMTKDGLLALSILRLVQDDKYRTLTGRNGRRRALRLFSRAKVMENVIDMYQDALSRASRLRE